MDIKDIKEHIDNYRSAYVGAIQLAAGMRDSNLGNLRQQISQEKGMWSETDFYDLVAEYSGQALNTISGAMVAHWNNRRHAPSEAERTSIAKMILCDYAKQYSFEQFQLDVMQVLNFEGETKQRNLSGRVKLLGKRLDDPSIHEGIKLGQPTLNKLRDDVRVKTIGQLASLTESDLQKSGFSEHMRKACIKLLKTYGLSLGGLTEVEKMLYKP